VQQEKVWHPYTSWEEVSAGMWRNVYGDERRLLLEKAIEFTGDHTRYGLAMVRVTEEWARSCEHNLTDLGQNRRAWIGHAACCLACGIPEDVTREAWGFLTEKQREDANAQADAAIAKWTRARSKGMDQGELFL
jgi:hypothetical protein